MSHYQNLKPQCGPRYVGNVYASHVSWHTTLSKADDELRIMKVAGAKPVGRVRIKELKA